MYLTNICMLAAIQDDIYAIVATQCIFNHRLRVAQLVHWQHTQFWEELLRNNKTSSLICLHIEVLILVLRKVSQL